MKKIFLIILGIATWFIFTVWALDKAYRIGYLHAYQAMAKNERQREVLKKLHEQNHLRPQPASAKRIKKQSKSFRFMKDERLPFLPSHFDLVIFFVNANLSQIEILLDIAAFSHVKKIIMVGTDSFTEIQYRFSEDGLVKLEALVNEHYKLIKNEGESKDFLPNILELLNDYNFEWAKTVGFIFNLHYRHYNQFRVYGHQQTFYDLASVYKDIYPDAEIYNIPLYNHVLRENPNYFAQKLSSPSGFLSAQ